MIAEGNSQTSLSKKARVKNKQKPMLFDLQDKELIEERIAQGLRLDKPNEVKLIR